MILDTTNGGEKIEPTTTPEAVAQAIAETCEMPAAQVAQASGDSTPTTTHKSADMSESELQTLLQQQTWPSHDESLQWEQSKWKCGPSPGSLLCDQARPPSPSNVCDFPYFQPVTEQNNSEEDNNAIPVKPTPTRILPAVPTTRTALDLAVHSMSLEMDAVWEDIPPQQVNVYDEIAGMGTYGRHPVIHRATGGSLANTGANCSMTAHFETLENVVQLTKPIVIGLAVGSNGSLQETAQCTHVGDYPITCDDGSTIYTRCFFNSNASDTIISPQSIVDASPHFDSWEQIGRGFGHPGQLRFIGPAGCKTITLHQRNGLYYCNERAIDIIADGDATDTPSISRTDRPRRLPKWTQYYKPTSKAKILDAETWHLHCR